MADNLTPEQRSRAMKAIKYSGTSIEMKLRKELWSRGLRYRKNPHYICGRPDIAFIGKKVAVFCDGEFWHGKDWDKKKPRIKTNREHWIETIEGKMQQDREVNAALES